MGSNTDRRITVLMFNLASDKCNVRLSSGGLLGCSTRAKVAHYGDKKLDDQMADLCYEDIKRKTGKEVNITAKICVKRACLKAKRQLLQDGQVDVALGKLILDRKYFDITVHINKQQFEAMCQDLLLVTYNTVSKVLLAARATSTEVSEVLLTGDYTNIPVIREKLDAFFQDKGLKSSTLAERAVRQAAGHAGNEGLTERISTPRISEAKADKTTLDVIPEHAEDVAEKKVDDLVTDKVDSAIRPLATDRLRLGLPAAAISRNKEDKGEIASMERVGDYTVAHQLGRGAYGTVHLARKQGAGFYALKLVHTGKIDDEANISTLPVHENVVRVYEHFQYSNDLCLVLEYCREGNLNDYAIKRDMPMSTKVQFMLDIANGIEHLHKQGIIHKDIKPQNVLISCGKVRRQVCKVSDYGLSKRGGDCTVFCSSLIFMAPEVFSQQFSTAADVFSLGLLYFCFTLLVIQNEMGADFLLPEIQRSGRRKELKALIQSKDFTRTENKDIFQPHSPLLGDIVYDMLDLDPASRPDISKVKECLEEISKARSASFSLHRQIWPMRDQIYV